MLTESGRLLDKFLPAVYLDSSVLIDYWVVEGMENEIEEAKEIREILERNEPKAFKVFREILKSDVKLNKVVEIRKKFVFGGARVTPVVTPLSLLELMKWNAESGFRQYASEAAGAMHIRKMGEKAIGDYLKKVLDLRKAEVEHLKGETLRESTGLEWLMADTWLDRSFAEFHGLQGLLQVVIKNFNLNTDDAWQEPSAYAFMQLGMADIMHIMAAKHLGCSYFASWDEDFKRIRDIMFEEAGLTLLSSPEEILATL